MSRGVKRCTHQGIPPCDLWFSSTHASWCVSRLETCGLLPWCALLHCLLA